jgi:MbtH protein
MQVYDEQANALFEVVSNHEEQFSIWPADKAVPAGWKTTGNRGNREECLERIKELWTDMRPLSLRNEMLKMGA